MQEMHERERRRASASTISGKRLVRSLPGRAFFGLAMISGVGGFFVAVGVVGWQGLQWLKTGMASRARRTCSKFQ